MTLPLSNRTAIITGASAGIGLAIAEDLIAAGARAVINARRADKLRAAADTLNRNSKPPAAIPVPGDAADQSTVDALFTATTTHFRAEPDLIVVNAGRGLAGSVLTSDTAQWDDMLRTNITAAALLMRTAANRMLADLEKRDNNKPLARPRDIIVLGSVVGRHVSPFSSMYGSTKFAVHGLTEGLRRELAPKGIRVTLVEPGFVVSEFQGVAGYKEDWFQGVLDRIGPVLQPIDVARAVTFACSQPPHAHIGDILIRPTRQDYP